MKVSDYVIKFLLSKGIRDIFMVAGGGIMHLLDSVGNNKSINYFCNYNEQATTYCAEGYIRAKNHISACLVTTGPGSTNAISGVASCWVDSIPLIVISGQVKRELIADYSKLRQIGEQEINIIDMVRPITKYAKMVTSPEMIGYELEKAFYTATTQRPGPVWIGLPLDIQAKSINPRLLRHFIPRRTLKTKRYRLYLRRKVIRTVEMLRKARRPLILLGQGVRLSKAEGLLAYLVKRIRIPIVLSFNGMDLLPDDHPLVVGRPGIIGQRRGNFAVQNSDCLLVVGSRLNIKIVSYKYKGFAPRAKKIIVDVDQEELRKPTLSSALTIRAEAKDFLEELLMQLRGDKITAPKSWLDICQNWRRHYPSVVKEFFKNKNYVNTYVFYDKLSDLLSPQDVVVSGNGLAAVCLYQAFKVKKNQRVFTNNGYGAMGWGLPASIGACIAHAKRRTICVTGDGSIQMNIQELQLIKHHNLPVKIFIFNNRGYTSIRLTQDTFFEGRYVGADKNSGVSNPDFSKIAKVYNLAYERISNNQELSTKISKVLSVRGPILCELNISPQQGIIPKTTSYKRADGVIESRPLEDMFPFLSRKELEENMSISED